MRYSLGMLVFWSVLPGVNAFGQRIGLLNKLYEAYEERQIAEELQLTDSEIEQLQELYQGFRSDQRDLIQEVVRLTSIPVPPGDVPWQHLQPEVTKLNREMIRSTTSVLGRRQFSRYRQLLLQKFLREWRFEEAAALQGCQLRPAQRKAMQVLLRALQDRAPERLAVAKWEMCSEPLLDFVSAAKLAEARGAPYGFAGVPRSIFGAAEERVDDASLGLISRAKVQVHLEFHPQQSRQVEQLVKHWRHTLTQMPTKRELRDARRAEDAVRIGRAEVAYAEALEQAEDQLSVSVMDLLDAVQKQRLKQLLLQRYVLQREFVPALSLMGLEVSSGEQELVRAADDVKRRLRYLDQRDRIWVGIQVMDVLLGEGKAERLLGKVTLAPEDPFGQDEQLRHQLTKLWLEDDVAVRRHPRRDGG